MRYLVTVFCLLLLVGSIARADELYDAVVEGRSEVINAYLEAGGDPNATVVQTVEERYSARAWKGPILAVAIFTGNDVIATRLLKAGAAPGLVTPHFSEPFVALAAQQGMRSAVRHVIDQDPTVLVRGDEIRSPLIVASAYDRHDVVITMLEAAKLHGIHWEGRMDMALIEAARAGNSSIVETLLAAGAEIQSEGRIMLHLAVLYLSHELVKRVLDAGLDPVERMDGWRPMDLAVWRLERESDEESAAVFRSLFAATPEPCTPIPFSPGRSSFSASTIDHLGQLAPECDWPALLPDESGVPEVR